MSFAGDLAAILTAVATVVAVAAGYVQFVLKRSLLPSVEFDIDFANHYRGSTQVIGEMTFAIHNAGSSMLIVTNVRCRGRYRLAEDTEGVYARDELEPSLEHRIPDFFLLKSRTFVQPGVTQRYRKPVTLPPTVLLLKVVGAFDYRIEIGRATNALIWLFARPPKDIDWRRGITNHTAERTFLVDMGSDRAAVRPD